VLPIKLSLTPYALVASILMMRTRTGLTAMSMSVRASNSERFVN